MRYKMIFSYDGTSFYGYQRQPSKKTVEGEIEKILTSINNNKKVSISSSGRTDKGVHAKHQVAHFDLDVDAKTYGLVKALNRKLNNEILVKEISEVHPAFHARYDVFDKTYSYYINTLEYDIFNRNYVYQYCKELDIEMMKRASLYLIGKHNFSLLSKLDEDKKNYVRTIKDINVTKSLGVIKISICADGFLRKMVRNIVGLLIEVGSSEVSCEDVLNYLDNEMGIHNKKVAPSCGLYLENVRYRE